MFGRAGKIPITYTLIGIAEMDFSDYWDLPNVLHIRDTFSRFSAIALSGTKKQEAQAAEIVKEIAIPNWLAVFKAPGIMEVLGDSGFIGEVFQEFCNARNIALQTAIPGHHQSLGATERRGVLFRSFIEHVIGNRKPNRSSQKEWGGFLQWR